MAFLKTILIILLIYYLLKILARWFAPKLFGYAAKRAEKHFQESFGAFPGQNHEEEEHLGNKSKHTRRTNKKASEQVGEYIDFEEID